MTAFAIAGLSLGAAKAIDISANGTAVGNGGISVTTNADSVITGPGSYTITSFGIATVENNNSVTVSGSGTNEGKLVVASGIYTNNAGAITTFKTGGLLQNNDNVINAGTMTFDKGSRYAGSGTLLNLHSLSIHSETSNVDHLIDNISMASGSMTLHGSVEGLGGKLAFTGGLAHTRVILAMDAGGTFTGDVTVGASELEITTSTTFAKNVSAAGIAIHGGVTTFAGGAATSTGTVNIASGSEAVFAASATLTAAGDIVIDGGSALHFAVSSGGGAPVVSTGGDIVLAPSETIAVTLSGSRADILGKHLLEASSGTIANAGSLESLFYILGHKTSGAGEAVYVSGYRAVNDIVAGAFGGDSFMSKNKRNGGTYTDAVFATTWGAANADLNNYIQELAAPGLGNSDRIAALGQLYGEYGAYASSPLAISSHAFAGELDNRMRGFAIEEIYEYADGYASVACGDRPGGLWTSGLGHWETRNGKNNIHGYDYSSSGVAMGYDYHNERLSIGFAGGYSYGKLKVDGVGAEFHTDTLHLGLYGDYFSSSGMYVKAKASYGRGWNEYDVAMTLGGGKDADYMNSAYAASLEVGYSTELGSIRITPSVGVDYTHITQDKWTENIRRHGNAPILANTFAATRRNIVDVPLALRLETSIQRGNTVFCPSVRAAWIYQANDRTDEVRAGYAGYAGSGRYVRMYGAEAGAGRLSLGAGLSAKVGERVSASALYSFDYSGGYRNHTLSGALGIGF